MSAGFFLFFSDNFTVSLLSAIADACIRASYKRTLFLLPALGFALCPGCLTARGFSLAELKHETSAIPSVRSLGLRNASFPSVDENPQVSPSW